MSRKLIKDVEPEAFKAVLGMEQYIRKSSLPKKLCELIKIRASQLNGCSYCLDMHTQEGIKEGEDIRRLFAIAAWHESPLFTEEERHVLQLTEEVTLIGEQGVTDDTYDAVLNAFGEKGIAQIIMQIIIINTWNRMAVACQQVYEGE